MASSEHMGIVERFIGKEARAAFDEVFNFYEGEVSALRAEVSSLRSEVENLKRQTSAPSPVPVTPAPNAPEPKEGETHAGTDDVSHQV